MRMKIKKTNGKPASKKIHLLADVVLETSVINARLMSDKLKKELMFNSDECYYTKETVSEMSSECINHRIVFQFAHHSWYSGSFNDFDLDFDSVYDYFFYWGIKS